jgi:hypothetical protein
MRTSEVLDRAADLIEERGWTKGAGGWQGDRLCIEGAIHAAAGMKTHPVIDWPLTNLCPAGLALRDHLSLGAFTHERRPWPDLTGSPLSRWNDNAESAGEVIAALRAAAVIEEARESALVSVDA